MDLGSIVSWLKGEPAKQPSLGLEQAPPLSQYPGPTDADYARKYQFGHGSGNEPYLNNEQARVMGDWQDFAVPVKKTFERQRLFAPASVSDRRSAESLPDPKNSSMLHLNEPQHQEIRGILDNTYMRAALAANRVPVASIGFDPDKTNLDVVSGMPNILGITNPDTGNMWSAVSPQDAIVHESTHAGLEKLRQAYPDKMGELSKHLPSEEMQVRYLMKALAGNPEKDLAEIYQRVTGVPAEENVGAQQRKDAINMFEHSSRDTERQKALNDVNELAIQYRKERNPRGPH